MKLKIQVTKTSRGDQDYVQIMSDDFISVNIVLVADSIKVSDERPTTPLPPNPTRKRRTNDHHT